MTIDSYLATSTGLFWDARRQARRELLRGKLFRQPVDCLPFEAVRTGLRLTFRRSEGIRDVPLNDIVGSVDRSQDFTRSFYPRRDALQNRWVRVAGAMSEIGLGPVSLFRIGEIYFVEDGNHRVSIARALDAPGIEAEVWGYPCRINLTRTLRLKELPCKAAYVQFLRHTTLDQRRPDQEVEMTACERYPVLEEHIAGHAKWLEGRTGGRVVPIGEAVASWYDRVYLPLVEIICDRGLCNEFPHLTDADLYALLLEHRKNLSVLWDRPVSLNQAIEDYVRRHGRRPLTRFRRWVRIPRRWLARRRRPGREQPPDVH